MTKFKNYLLKSIVFVFLSLFFVQFVSAQVTSVNYHLKYDNLRGYTDCYLVINQDSATTELERVQGNVQYSLVVPTGTEIKIGEIYMPLLNNADYEGIYPVEWTLGNVVIAPAAQSASDFYSVSVDLDPSSYYNNLYQGDEIKLFRVYIDSLCSNEIRLYQNGIDPPSDAEGMEGIDFSQSFSLGTFGELYDTIVTAQGYLPEIYGDTTICDGDVIYLSTDIIEGCTYIWEGNDTLTYPNQAKIKVHSSSFNGNSPITLRVMKDSLCMSPSSSHYVTVNDIPDVSFDGSNEICVGSTTNLLPNTGGYWTVSNPIVATVNIDGIVTGISPGVTYPTFIDTFGCSATTAIPIEVVYTPTVVVDDYMLNIGETTQAHPIYGCTWTSSNLAVLSISNSGVITAVGQGVATVSCTVNETGCVVTSNPITVNDCPSVCLTGPSNICVGQTTTLSPSTGGTWASSNTNIATVTNSGIITGIGSGTVTFIFTFAGGCSSTACIVVTVYPEPIINPASQHICVGSTTNLTASSSGTWSSTNSSIATVNSNTGTVTGVSIGTTQILFTDSTTGCTATSTIYVGASSNFVINGPTQICIGGTTQAVSTENGTWTSSNTSVAIINSSGTITGVGVGTACINFIPNCGCGCTEPICISVVSAPAACLTGPDHICVDGITTLSPTSGGTWTSSSPSVATVTNSGVVTGVSPGTVTFTFASNGGCNSTTCVAVTVYSQPILSASQPSICIAHTTNLTSSTNGTWTSLDTHATITSAGVVTGVSEGIAHFLFTDSVTGCTETISINILSTPIIQVNGPTEICVGGTSNVSSNTNGVWTSSNPAVATVTNYGVITGISEGTSCISFISSGSCGCAQPICITVMPGTDVEIEDNSICIAETTNLTPSTGGAWVSSNPTIATVSNSGIVTGLSAGVTSFTFTNSSTGCTGSVSVEVLTSPVIEANGPTELCVGGTTSVSSNTDGIWASSNPAVATIDINTGLITAVSEGITCISFTGLSSSCACAQPVCITVMPGVSTYITGDNNICISGTTTISPAIGGTWVSNNPAVATISNSGVVTAIGEGTATFTYSANETGCTATSEIVTVLAHPIIEVDGTDKLCIGESTNVSANTDGVWSSSIPSVATVDNNGVVTAVSEGVTCISFTSSATSCPCSQPICITVSPSPVVEITGEDNICIEGTTTLSPTTGGTWISYDNGVATINNSGVVTGISQGITCFVYTDIETGCVSDEVCVTVGSCTPCDTTDVPLVLGTAYIDENENGVFDTGETVLSNVTIQITPDGMMVLTNEQGEYQIAADYGEYTLTAIINEGDWVTNELTSSINITDICNEGNDFGFVPNPAEPELVLSFSHSMLRCDYETQFFIDFKNVGTEHFTGQLEFYYDPLTDFIDAGPNPISNSNNKLVFDIVDLRPFKRKTYIVVVRNPPASDPLPFMTFKAEIKTTSGEVVASYEKTKQLRCAFDPNDKSTYPDRQGEDNLTLFSEEVDYMIRFQNTGNDIAYNIKVEDKLDANMDPTTIRVLSSSHPVETMIESGKIVFFFDDINLVDSTVNYRESQGYVKFRVRQLGFRAENTEVFNDANIIFDNNPPITTNEVKNTLVGKLCSNSLIYVNKAICPGSEYLGYTEEGHYIDTLQSTYGCDSIRSLQLVFADVPQISIDTTICPIDDIYGYNTTGTYEFTIPSEEGCDTLVNLNLEVLDDNNPKCLVADNNVEKEVVKVYPNPTNNMIYISGVSNNVKMRMTSMTGETIYINPEFENDKVSIRTVGLPSGVYYLTIFSEYEVVVKKITKL